MLIIREFCFDDNESVKRQITTGNRCGTVIGVTVKFIDEIAGLLQKRITGKPLTSVLVIDELKVERNNANLSHSINGSN